MRTAREPELALRVFSEQLTKAALPVSLSVMLAMFFICATPYVAISHMWLSSIEMWLVRLRN